MLLDQGATLIEDGHDYLDQADVGELNQLLLCGDEVATEMTDKLRVVEDSCKGADVGVDKSFEQVADQNEELLVKIHLVVLLIGKLEHLIGHVRVDF